MNSIGDKSIGFEDEAGAEDQTDIPATGELGNGVGLLEDIDIDQEADPDEQENYGAGEIDEAIRVLEEADLPVEEEPSPAAMETRPIPSRAGCRTLRRVCSYGVERAGGPGCGQSCFRSCIPPYRGEPHPSQGDF